MSVWVIPIVALLGLAWVLCAAAKLADRLEADAKAERERRWRERRPMRPWR